MAEDPRVEQSTFTTARAVLHLAGDAGGVRVARRVELGGLRQVFAFAIGYRPAHLNLEVWASPQELRDFAFALAAASLRAEREGPDDA